MVRPVGRIGRQLTFVASEGGTEFWNNVSILNGVAHGHFNIHLGCDGHRRATVTNRTLI